MRESWFGAAAGTVCKALCAQEVVTSAALAGGSWAAQEGAKALRTHFRGTLPEVREAVVWGYERAVRSLQVALAGSAGLLTDADTKRAAEHLEERVLGPFFAGNPEWGEGTGWQVVFRKSAAGSCGKLLAAKGEVLEVSKWSEEELAEAIAVAGGGVEVEGRGLLGRLGEVLDRDGEDSALWALCEGVDPERSVEGVLLSWIRVHVRVRAQEREGLRSATQLLALERVEARVEEVQGALQQAVRELRVGDLGVLTEEVQRLTKLREELEERGREAAAYREAVSEGAEQRWEQAVAALEGIRGELRSVRAGVGRVEGGVEELLKRVGELEGLLKLESRVRLSDSVSIRGEEELRRVKEVLRALRGLPEGARDVRVVVGEGRLLLACGKAEEAAERFEAARRRGDGGRQAFNAFMARLEAEDWEGALARYREAVAGDEKGNCLFGPHDFPVVERVLGAGGFGVAFLCRNKLGRQRVVKALLEGSAESTKRVQREAELLQRVESEFVAKVYDYGWAVPWERARPYLVLEYAGEWTLRRWVEERGVLGWEEGVEVLRGVAEGLSAAHAVGVLHRDVKPGNVLLEERGGKWAPKVIDFGLGVEQRAEEEARRSRSRSLGVSRSGGGGLGGTWGYSAPEQLRNGGEVGPWSDVYGFGRTACWLLFGRPEPRRRDWKVVPEWLGELLEDCLEERGTDRPQGFEEVLERLQEGGGTRVEVVEDPVEDPAPLSEYEQALVQTKALKGFVFQGVEGTTGRFLQETTGLVFRLISGGSYLMGSPEGVGYGDEKPEHQVRVEPFLLCESPCTQRAWDRIAKKHGIEDNRKWKGEELPIERVKWSDVQRWCEKVGLRLPSEAEWEYACRAGSTGAYCFGESEEELRDYAWFEDNSGGRTNPVGQKKPNAWGLFDMHGNVWEWCEDDWEEHYKGAPSVGWPARKVAGASKRACRGGSWYNSASYCRSAYRNGYGPGYRADDLGFRPARSYR